jgi:hypothetical protein
MHGAMSEDDIAQLRMQLYEARRAHAELSAEVDDLAQEPQPDQLRLARLKKRKLFLKDQIVRLESQLTPDLIA